MTGKYLTGGKRAGAKALFRLRSRGCKCLGIREVSENHGIKKASVAEADGDRDEVCRVTQRGFELHPNAFLLTLASENQSFGGFCSVPAGNLSCGSGE